MVSEESTQAEQLFQHFHQRLASRALLSDLLSDDCVSAPEFLPFKIFSVSFRDWDRTLENAKLPFAQLAQHCGGRPGLEGAMRIGGPQ